MTTELALLLDIGSAWAKAGVIGRSRGRWRLVAHAAQPTSWGARALRDALVEQLEAAGDRRLAGQYDELIGTANRIECHSPRRQARLALVAVSRELSGSAARRAAESAGWEVAPIVSLDDGKSLADRLRTLQSAEPDAWLAVGGFDDGASPRAIEVAALVSAARRPGSAPVVWAGSRRLADEVVSLFEADAAASVANPRPSARDEDTAPLREHLVALMHRVLGDEDSGHLAPVTLPRAIGALAAAGALSVLAVDIGARSALRVLVSPTGETSVRVSASGGVSRVALVPGGAGRVGRVALDAGDDAAIADLLQTQRAHPATIPQLPDELAALQAATRVALSALVEDVASGPVDLVIGSGLSIAAAPRPADMARMLLDGVRPVGVTQLAVDSASVLGPLGSLDDEELAEGLRLLADDLLLPLGTSIVTRGGEPGDVAMRVTILRPGWPTASPVAVRVGQLQVVPLARGVEAELIVELGPGISLGSGTRSRQVRVMATGGCVGLMLDARGVPIVLPRRGDDRRAVLAAWGDALAREPERPG
ncbi:MAG TPA: glutamate mutase L [Candidatus Limnocylindria bacterium]